MRTCTCCVNYECMECRIPILTQMYRCDISLSVSVLATGIPMCVPRAHLLKLSCFTSGQHKFDTNETTNNAFY